MYSLDLLLNLEKLDFLETHSIFNISLKNHEFNYITTLSSNDYI